jgi:SAM-dependent methyltransferase
MNLYQKVLGHPWVYERVRPGVVGGIDMSPAYERLLLGPESSWLDIGCGTGDALRYAGDFGQYLGLDTDQSAIAVARQRYSSQRARFENRGALAADFDAPGPTHVSMIGLLHHLSDAQAIDLLRQVARSPRLVRAVALDIVYLKGKHWNNLLAFLDRGRHCRTGDGYRALASTAGLRLVESAVIRSHPHTGRVQYLVVTFEPGSR